MPGRHDAVKPFGDHPRGGRERHRLHARPVNRGRGGGRGEKADDRSGEIRRLRVDGDAGRVHGHSLDRLRERSEKRDARHRKQLADLLKSDLGVAARDHCADPLAFYPPALRQDLVGDPEALKELRGEIDAADAGRVRNRFRLEERLSERLDRADVGRRRTGPHRHPNRRSREVDAAARDHPAVLHEALERRVGHDQHVRGLPSLQPILDGVRSRAGGRPDHDAVPGRAFELRGQLDQRRGKSA